MSSSQYFKSAQIFRLATGFIRPCLEYSSHVWGTSPFTSLLDRVESKAMIGDPSLTSTLDSLSIRCKVASLSLLYCYYFVHCSGELARPLSIRQASFAHNYYVELSSARINQFSESFFPSSSCLWNCLPFFSFSNFLQPPFLQKEGPSPLYGPDGMIFFCQVFFMHKCYYAFFFKDIIALCFITCHYRHLLPKGYILKKGHNGPILCSHSYRKKDSG